MAQFDYSELLPKLMVPEVMNAISSIHEYRGRQDLYLATKPDTMDKLCEVAKIQSTGASNKIENISTTDKRLRDLMTKKVEPKNRDEREITGYRYVLDMIHESYAHIDIRPNVILQLHRDLYRTLDVSFAGKWKNSDNIIQERGINGRMFTRFTPTSAVETPNAIERLCDTYNTNIQAGVYDPLLTSMLFTFDFVSIHPFIDGNGRMSRLLTLLLLYSNDYLVGKYVSIEQEIERSKETYYEALAASSSGWQDGKNDYLPFVTYLLGIILSCYKTLDERMGMVGAGMTNEKVVRNFFDSLVGVASKRDVADACPDMSLRTVERIIQRLLAEGTVEKVGSARATAYRKKAL